MEIKIDRIKPGFANVVSSTSMTKDDTGKYHYNYDSSGAVAGTYRVTYTATDGSRITIEKEEFTLE
jgi:hypothetical protein